MGQQSFTGKNVVHSLQVTLVVWLSSFSVDRIARQSLCDLPSHSINIPQIATEVISILQNIHEHGLSHNDIKPDHIVFDSHYSLLTLGRVPNLDQRFQSLQGQM